MFFLVVSLAAVEVLTLCAAFWFYLRQRHCVPARVYEQLAASYLDALLELAKANVTRPFSDEVDLS